jgi:hypothetical protein
MTSFADAFQAWKEDRATAGQIPSAETRQAEQQAHFALTHHPAAHRARGLVQRDEQRRRRAAR